MRKQSAGSALSPEVPRHGQGPLAGKHAVGSQSLQNPENNYLFFLSNSVNHEEEADLSCANEKNDTDWGPWLEEGLCIDPHGNGIHSNMQMSMQLLNQRSGICFLENSGHEKSGPVCLWHLTSGSGQA